MTQTDPSHVWQARQVRQADRVGVSLSGQSLDGDQGYPGAMTVTCRITLAPPQTLRIELWAITDAPTVLNLCHHSYFNLDDGTDVLDHELMIAAMSPSVQDCQKGEPRPVL